MLTLRPHQDRILARMQKYTKGQMIVPTGGGKTLTMIVDTQRRLDSTNNGTTTVVVAPRILLAEQLCSESTEQVSLLSVGRVQIRLSIRKKTPKKTLTEFFLS